LFSAHEKTLAFGFSLNLWLTINNLSKDKDVNILSIQKNVNFSPLRLGLKKGRFVLTIRDTKSEKEEVYFSEKVLKPRQTY
jgi:hypothetical protein